jgi:large subunit ribosomal protein L18
MSKIIDKKERREIRKKRTRVLRGTESRPRVVFSVSNRYLTVQAINDALGITLVYSSSRDLKENSLIDSLKNEDCAKKLGEVFANKLKKIGKTKIIFDRNARVYHGKIKAFCQSMRELGIAF